MEEEIFWKSIITIIFLINQYAIFSKKIDKKTKGILSVSTCIILWLMAIWLNFYH